LETPKGLTVEEVKARTPVGTKVIEEQWYSLERPAKPWLKLSTSLKAPRTLIGHAMQWRVRVLVDGGKVLKDALVTVLIDEEKGIGVELTTDRYGQVHFKISKNTKRVDAIFVTPLHSAWPICLEEMTIDPSGMDISVPALDEGVADVRGMMYGKPGVSGKGVKVGIVDTGVGRHKALNVRGGRNTTTKESPLLYRDEDGHGSHVAGVIASSAQGWRRGEASSVQLFAYRIFEANDPFASTFAISAAIKKAVDDGCDLINLSVGDSMADESVKDAVNFAWSHGVVCVAATGNDGRSQIDYPARYPKAIAVSAVGLKNSWPAGAFVDWGVTHLGKKLAGKDVFFASFSNYSKKVAITAPGVGVVSTIFDDRWGVMSGTSMATPIATGVLARRLADSPVFNLPPDEDRAEKIAKLLHDHGEDLGLSPNRQGRGLAR
jgi:minor extracellular protease Epr